MEYLNNIDSKVNEIYMRHATELEKEHTGDIVAIDFTKETVVGILKQENIPEWLKKLKNGKNTVAFRKIGSKEAVYRFR
ncbi:MAG: hypothetical protein ABOK23_00920 [Candidatus Methanoperedens sp.]|nr:hypothetical protein [Candidatus Methanoperedens sp.]MCZ7395915.1 hypothetical protein [Candidatus Methanoperedens sp.]